MSAATGHRYLIALGSNVRHPRHGGPRAIVAAALRALEAEGVGVLSASPIVASAPLGPSRRRYANAAAVIEGVEGPEALLERLHGVERSFGRRRRGRRWGARVLDLDIVLWSGGGWAGRRLVIPHPRFRERPFVIGPAAAIAPGWRDPGTGLTLRQLAARLTRSARLPRAAGVDGPLAQLVEQLTFNQ